MLEITRLDKITSNDFKKTIDEAIQNKHFIFFFSRYFTLSKRDILKKLGDIA